MALGSLFCYNAINPSSGIILMNVIFEIPEELQTHVMNQVKTGDHATTIEYVLDLVMCDRDRTLATGRPIKRRSRMLKKS